MRFKNFLQAEPSNSASSGAVDLRTLTVFVRKNKYVFALLFFALLAAVVLFRGDGVSTKQASAPAFISYAEDLRRELEQVLSSMDGVGKCTVMLTFSDAGETVYAVDESSSGSADGGRSSLSRQHVLLSSRSEGLVLRLHAPSVAGVAVICPGGDNVKVKSDVTEVLSRTLGISADRISVKKSN